MDDNELAKKLWDLANAVTAFSALQTMGILYPVLKGDFNEWLKNDTSYCLAQGGVLLSFLYYGLLITACAYEGFMLSSKLHGEVFAAVACGQVGTVLIFTGILFLVFRGRHRQLQLRQEKPCPA
jgi:hypothetical protein